jgi:hypothetical protein
MKEYIYVLVNEAMPGLVKIGRTNDLDGRLRELYKTGVPVPFMCHYAVAVPNTAAAVGIENTLHTLFAENRVNPRREFFRVSPERVVIALSLGNYEAVNRSLSDLEQPDSVIEKADVDAAVREETRRERIRFSKIGIPNGSELRFTRDNSIICTTLDDIKVLYDGKETSLSAAARDILQAKFNSQGSAFSGSQYWMYEGETLDERRQRMEQGD